MLENTFGPGVRSVDANDASASPRVFLRDIHNAPDANLDITTQFADITIKIAEMPRGIEGNEIATPRPPTLKKQGSSQSSKPSGKQQTLAGFFTKTSGSGSSSTITPLKRPANSNGAAIAAKAKLSSARPTPVPSSSAGPAGSSPPSALGASQSSFSTSGRNKENGTRSPGCIH